jgi:iron complex outermembrane recepter protein
MRSSHSLRIAIAAMLVSPVALAQESKLEEVIVTSTALRESPLEVAQPTEVVAGDELRRQIAGSIGETLSKELGMSSTYFGPTASRPIIRGLGGYRVQTLQDALASLDVAGLSQDHAVTVESVVSKQIEIIKGPAALLYGSGAAGGLVNVVTNRIPMSKAQRLFSGAVEVRGDTAEDERTGAVAVDGGTGLFAFHADYFDRETDDVEIPGFAQSDALRRQLIEAGEEPDNVRGNIANTSSDSKGGAFGASLIGEGARGGVSWSRYEATYGIPGEEQAFIDMQQDRFDAKGEWDLQGAFTALHVSGSYNDYTHTEFEAPGEPGTVFNQKAYDTRLTLDNDLGNGWRGTTGVQYVNIDFEALGDEAFVPPSVTKQMSVFAFEERHFDAWTLELGARAEKQRIDLDPGTDLPDYDATALSLSAGVVRKLSNENTLALNLTHTERNPQAAELYSQPDVPHVAAQRFSTGDPNLDQEKALTADLSLRHGGEGTQWTLSAFYDDYSDYIFENPTGVLLPTEEGEEFQLFDYLQADARFYGFEGEVLFPVYEQGERRLDLRVASDYVRGKLDDGSDLPLIPPLRFGVGMEYDQGDWHVGVDAYYYEKQDRIADNELPTESFTLVDLDTSYRLPVGAAHLFVFLRGTNLLDEDARQHASPLKDIAPLPGRSFHIGARAEF